MQNDRFCEWCFLKELTSKEPNTLGNKSLQYVMSLHQSLCVYSPGTVKHLTSHMNSLEALNFRFATATDCTKSNNFEFVWSVAMTKFCQGDKIFAKILLFRWYVAAMHCLVLEPQWLICFIHILFPVIYGYFAKCHNNFASKGFAKWRIWPQISLKIASNVL